MLKKTLLLSFSLVVTTCCTSRQHEKAQARVERVTKAEQVVEDETVAVVERLRSRKIALDGKRKTVLEEVLKNEKMFKKATLRTLEERGYEFLFSTEEGESRWAKALLKFLDRVEDHALKKEKYEIPRIEQAKTDMLLALSNMQSQKVRLAGDRAFEALSGFVMAKEPVSAEQMTSLKEAGRVPSLSRQELSGFEAKFNAYLDAVQETLLSRARFEVWCQVAFFRLVLDMKLLKIAHPFKADKDPGKADVIYLDELVKMFGEFAKDPDAFISDLPPKHPYYWALIEALKRYKKIEADGGFTQVHFTSKLKKGARGGAVLELRQRLLQEGYDVGDVSKPLFDDALEKALKHYQETHGFDPTGILEEKHARSLNVSIAKRIQQIELGLQRWRESEVDPAQPFYLRVNIPEFKLEVWEDGKLLRKHKVVVGNNNWDKDPDARVEGRINRTKIFSALLKQVVLNPRWYVPARIRRLELDYEVLNEPDYLEKKKFKVKVLPDGTEEIYQESGDDNALGRVKFVFPNPYGIFMHDTNQKEFFKQEIRAFSHGCIRLENPIELAYIILEKCASMSREQVQSLLATEKVHEIDLKTFVPIYVEYNTVGIDEDGHVEFYSDVYQYDKDFFEGKIPYSEEELKLLMRKIPRID